MLHIKEAIIVEGKFDKLRLKNVTDALVLSVNGFSVYKNKAFINSIRNLAKTCGIIILTDSDSAGFRIRNYITQCVGKDGVVKHAYIPSIEGKEKRKDSPGKEGLLGVEGISDSMIEDILRKVSESVSENRTDFVTKQDFFNDVLTGGDNSFERRRRLAKHINAPLRLSTNGLLELVNKLYTKKEYDNIINELFGGKQK